ncbi:MAG TPA: HNH endonuclease [Bacteroidetes bacterium]|nr:HNH endonuclease [Bacteroidota bacterium]
MNYWWVNQNQTYKLEVDGGYMWSPKVNKNGGMNPYYDNMTKVKIGDILFSFSDTRIAALGVITSEGYSASKPSDFDAIENWGNEGWCVNVNYHELNNQVRPKDSISYLLPFLPEKYSPLQINGNGNQNLYLTSLPEPFAKALLDLIGEEATIIIKGLMPQDVIEVESDRIQDEIRQNNNLGSTEKQQIVKSRRGQGVYRTNLERIENSCRITGVSAKEYLRASHIKPWRDSSNHERLDGYNGLLLAPHIDFLFDKGYISFSDDGMLLISEKANKDVLSQWGISSSVSVGDFYDKQKEYLAYHRRIVFQG